MEQKTKTFHYFDIGHITISVGWFRGEPLVLFKFVLLEEWNLEADGSFEFIGFGFLRFRFSISWNDKLYNL